MALKSDGDCSTGARTAVSDETCGDGWTYNADAAASFCFGASCDPAAVAYDKRTCCSWTAWAQAAGRRCEPSDRIASHGTQAEAQAACEADAACLSIYDESCDGEGDWSACDSATGASSSSGSCLYVQP